MTRMARRADGELENTHSGDEAESTVAMPAARAAIDAGRVFRIEFIISMLVNMIVFPALIWLAHVPPPATIQGSDGLLADAFKASAFAVLFLTIGITVPMR